MYKVVFLLFATHEALGDLIVFNGFLFRARLFFVVVASCDGSWRTGSFPLLSFYDFYARAKRVH